jgi:hypothetical protein
MPLPLTWHISQIIVDVHSLVVFTCVFNQFKGHWLLSDALNFAIFICLKLKKLEFQVLLIILWKKSPLLFFSYVFRPITLEMTFVVF